MAHSHQAESMPLTGRPSLCRLAESHAVVTDIQGHLILHIGQRDLDLPRRSVLSQIRQRLLSDAKQGYLGLRVHRLGVCRWSPARPLLLPPGTTNPSARQSPPGAGHPRARRAAPPELYGVPQPVCVEPNPRLGQDACASLPRHPESARQLATAREFPPMTEQECHESRQRSSLAGRMTRPSTDRWRSRRHL